MSDDEDLDDDMEDVEGEEDAEDDEDGEEASGDEELPAKPKSSRVNDASFRAPTSEEMVELRETKELFKSNLFRLQIQVRLPSTMNFK